MKHLSARVRPASLAGLLVLLSLLLGPGARGQAPAWQMATAFSPTNALSYASEARATATDAAGNVYVAGLFSGTATFGAVTLTSAGGTDVFIAKYNPRTASLAWVQQAGGPGSDVATGIAVTGSSVYVAGFFTGTAAFGGFGLTSAGAEDGFVAKLTDAGTAATFTWAQALGGTGSDRVYGLAVNGTGVYAAGFFSGTAAFGSAALTTAGSIDAFVVKLVDAGASPSLAWAQRGGGAGPEVVTGLALSGSSVYLTGYFIGTASAFGATSIASVGGTDVFVAKLTDGVSAGTFVWAQGAGGLSDDYAFGLAAAGASVYVVGRFTSRPAAFGTTTLTNSTVGTTLSDVFVAKLTDAGATGAFVWAQQAGGTDDDVAVSVAVRGPNVYVAGFFNSRTATFGTTTVTTAGAFDVFVTKLLDAGATSTFAWTQTGGGTGTETCYALALGGSSVYAAGSLAAPSTFGGTTVTGAFGGLVGYLASLTDPTLTATAAAPSSLSFALAPNPARAATTLTLPARPGAATATLTLLDALGRTLRIETLPLPAAGLRHEISLSGLPASLYALRVTAGPATATRRLVVE